LADSFHAKLRGEKPTSTCREPFRHEFNELLAQPCVAGLPPDLLLGVLTVSLSAQGCLPNHKPLYDRVCRELGI
jgi:hypothetical protein